MHFDEMNATQRRLHNAACVIEAEGDEHGFAKLQRDAIAEIEELRRLLRQLLNTKEGISHLSYLRRGIGTATQDVVWLDAAKHLGDS